MPLQNDRQGLQLPLAFQPERRIFKVAELNANLQAIFEAEFSQIWISGEISGYRASAAGHHYFCLKEAESQVKCVIFKNAARFLRVKPKDGLAIAAQGSLELYQARGEYQLIVDRFELYGVGSLQLAFNDLKARLAAEGLFNADRKRSLPRLPHRLGLVTSQSGAVLQDMLQVLSRRFPGLHIRLFPAQVQGEASVDQLCTAINYFSEKQWAEVIIVARGGGSLEDLWSFNDERLARAVACSKVPVISAVGHETDFTICDFVADVRAPTPSAAAEIVICTRESLLAHLNEFRSRLNRGIRYQLLILAREVGSRSGDRGGMQVRRAITSRLQRLDEADQKLARAQRQLLDQWTRRLDSLARRLEDTNLPLRFARIRHRQDLLTESLRKQWRAAYWRYRQRFDVAASHLTQLSPLSVLSRGYAIVETASGQILRSSAEASVNQELSIRVQIGRLKAVVSEIDPRP